MILDDTSCEPPCWQSITPGETISQDALAKLSSIREINSNIVQTPILLDEARSYDSWVFSSKVKERGGDILFINNIVVKMSITLDSVNFSEMMKHVGEPEQVSVISGWADTQWLVIVLLYPNQGTAIKHYDSWWRPSNGYAEIKPTTKVTEIIYFDSNYYDDLLHLGEIIKENYEVIIKSLQPWSGYGEVLYLDRSKIR